MQPTGFAIFAALLALFGLAGAAVAWVRARQTPAAPSRSARPAKPVRADADGPLGSDEHWRRASSIVTTANDQMTAMRSHQSAAAGHLDSADYALQQLKDELAHLVPVAPRVPAATLHQLKPAPAARQPASPGKAAAA